MRKIKTKEIRSFDSKLKSYSAAAAGILAVGAAQAQIIYTNVDPDITLSDSSYMLDLNNDQVPDFSLVHIQYSYGSTSFLNLTGLQALNNNEVLGDTIVSGGPSYNVSFFPAMLNNNEDINEAGQIWYNDQYGMIYYLGSYGGNQFKNGNWENTTDKYLGLRIKISGKWHYGWARLDISANGASFTIKDYAYESYPEKHIMAGMQVSGMFDTEGFVKIFAGQKNLFINTSGLSIKDQSISIFNTMGKEIWSGQLNEGQTSISLENFANGVYIARYLINGQLITQKFIIR